ncbi:ribokinase isoform X1 [Arachis ipaensis]|uniref:ribokinase isoform X1 n=1 Tax=Arachis ipaensis TaxID=130454 RepID=UPI0007AF9BDB|nr:ribokinase isoform X1 [Arachis ipaensis]
MSSDSDEYGLPLPESCIIVGFGGVCVDLLATVTCFPVPDSKMRSTQLKVQGGGNAGNALTCAARLGLKPRIIAKVANDIQGRALLEELEVGGVDTSFMVVSKEGTTPFSYIIIDTQTKTRTCIFNPGEYPPMKPEDLHSTNLVSILAGSKVVYFDGRMLDTAIVIAQEAFQQNIPILVDAEKPRVGLDNLLRLTDYIICSENFPQAWTEASTISKALVSIMLRLPKLKFVIVTLGKDGCIMLERCVDDISSLEEMDIDSTFESLSKREDDTITMPTCIASSMMRFRTKGEGCMCGRLYIGTAEKIPPSKLIDTTGAGDAFVGAILYAICANFSPQIMLTFASYVAATNCKALGARSGLPYRTDPCLKSFTH